ncbi:MAG: nitroreductase family protein [Pseudonocardiaceae bacterium]
MESSKDSSLTSPLARWVLKAILSRRSVRKSFTTKPLSREILSQIVQCALAAPSSKNAQPWRLHVVSDRAKLREFADVIQFSPDAATYVPRDPVTGNIRPDWKSTAAESAEVLRQVATGVFVENRGVFSGGRPTLAAAKPGTSLVGYTFEVVGIGAAIQNMWLAAHSLGVSGTFMGDVLIAEQEIRLRLGINGDLVGVLALGYSDALGPATGREFDTADPGRVVWHDSP